VLVPRLKRTVFRSKDSQELVGSGGLFVSYNGIIIDALAFKVSTNGFASDSCAPRGVRAQYY
jgi:hypothetical protein